MARMEGVCQPQIRYCGPNAHSNARSNAHRNGTQIPFHRPHRVDGHIFRQCRISDLLQRPAVETTIRGSVSRQICSRVDLHSTGR